MESFSFVDNVNFVVILFLFFSFAFAFIGSYVFSKNEKNIRNIIMLFMCIGFCFTCIGDAFSSWTFHEPDVYLFHAFAAIGFVTFWPLTLNLFVLFRDSIRSFNISIPFTKNKKKIAINLWYVFIGFSYLISIFYICITFLGITASVGYTREKFSWIDQPTESFWYNPIYTSIIFPIWVIFTFYNVFKIRKEAKSKSDFIRKRQFDIILFWGAPMFILGATFNVYSPMFGIKLPAIGHIFSGFWIIAVGYAVTKYKFLVPTLEYAAKQIFDIGGEINIVTDLNLQITDPNQASIKKLGYKFRDQMRGVNFNDILLNKNDSLSISDFNGKEITEKEVYIIGLNKEKYCANIKASFLYNNKIKIGVVFVLSDITDLKNQNEVLEQKVKERTEELQKEKDESEKRLSITETYTRKSLVHRIENGFDPRTIEPEEKKVAIMFSDIRHFTSISEHLSPRKTVNLLNSYFNEINNCVIGSSNKGEIDKIIGDAVMAIFDNSKYAIDSAIDIRRRLPKLNDYIQKEYNIRIDNGIGINFGSVTYGNIGSDQKLDFTVIGDSVNLASRIEELTKYYNVPILISEATMQNINCDDYKIRFIDEIKVKGKENSTKIFEIFDYEREDIIEMKQNNQHYLDEAFKLYQIADFDNALKIYKKLEMEMPRHNYNPKFPADSVLTFYISRCQRFIKLRHDRPEMIQNWSGVYSFVAK